LFPAPQTDHLQGEIALSRQRDHNILPAVEAARKLLSTSSQAVAAQGRTRAWRDKIETLFQIFLRQCPTRFSRGRDIATSRGGDIASTRCRVIHLSRHRDNRRLFQCRDDAITAVDQLAAHRPWRYRDIAATEPVNRQALCLPGIYGRCRVYHAACVASELTATSRVLAKTR